MATFPQRRLLTDHLLTALQNNLEYLIAVADQPRGAGWSDDPRKDGAVFRPYSVLTPMTAQQSQGGIGQPQDYWVMPYGLTSFGVAPEQVEWQADQARQVLADTNTDELNVGYDANIQAVWLVSIGTMNRVSDNLEYPYWAQADVLSIALSRD